MLCETIAAEVEKSHRVRAVSIGIPGYVDDGVVALCDEEKLIGFDLRGFLSQRVDIPVIVGAEKSYKVLGYSKRMHMKGHETLVYLLAPAYKEMGVGIMVDGHVLQGGNELAGETMYLPYYFMKAQGLDVDAVMDELTNIIVSLTAAIAPQTFIVTGARHSQEECNLLRKQCTAFLPEKHVPEILYVEDPMEDYRLGLMEATFNQLDNSLQIVSSEDMG